MYADVRRTFRWLISTIGPLLPNLEVVDVLQVPSTLKPGNYVLQWRWDCKFTPTNHFFSFYPPPFFISLQTILLARSTYVTCIHIQIVASVQLAIPRSSSLRPILCFSDTFVLYRRRNRSNLGFLCRHHDHRCLNGLKLRLFSNRSKRKIGLLKSTFNI